MSCATAKDVKKVSAKKTDEADAEWIMLMHSYDLLKPSFHPDAAARNICGLARHHGNMLRSAGKEIQHMQKLLVLMNIKVNTAISDILGKQPRAEQQELRRQTSLKQGAEAEEQSRAGVQTMRQLGDICLSSSL